MTSNAMLSPLTKHWVAPTYSKRPHSRRLCCGVSTSCDSTKWIRITPGLDDFRCGPPSIKAGKIKPSRKTVSKVLDEEFTVGSKGYTKQSRIFPILKRRPSKADDISQLRPTVLLPILEQRLPPDVFQNLLGLLHNYDHDYVDELKQLLFKDGASYNDIFNSELTADSELRKISLAELGITGSSVKINNKPIDENLIALQKLSRPSKTKSLESTESDHMGLIKDLLPYSTAREKEINPYRNFLLRLKDKHAVAFSAKEKGKRVKPVRSKHDRAQIKDLAYEFCQWTKEFCKEEADLIDRDKLMSLFGMDAKQAVIIPELQVLDKLSIPVGLKGNDDVLTGDKGSKDEDWITEKKPPTPSKRYRYGAWYLGKNLWRRMPVDEQLAIPEESKPNGVLDEKTKILNDSLKPLFVTKLFKEYCLNEHVPFPKYLKSTFHSMDE